MRSFSAAKSTGRRRPYRFSAAAAMDDISRFYRIRPKDHGQPARYNKDMPKPAVLVVDDEPDLCELLSITLQRMDLDPRTADTVADAQRLLKTEHFDLCLTDMQLPDGDGLDLVKWIQQYSPNVPVAVITAHGNMETAVRALKHGAFDFVSKPLDLAGLRKLVASAIKLSGTQDGDTSVFGPRLLGTSAAMQHLRDMIGRVARSQAPVHIFGESGTGKELVAKLIHESGPRRDGPFVPVNCGAIPTELMESELFGHKRGSFTGAVSDKKGLVQSAEGGTLFLDEVADLRILSATHKNLPDLVAQGLFREDLFYRINVIELRVPALRERSADIGQIAAAILRRVSRRAGGPSPEISKEALATLSAYPFPGNVRELENVLERAMTLCTGGVITPEHIRLRASAPAAETEISAAVRSAAPGGMALGSQLETIERDAIIKALEKTRYNKTAAAKLLGMSFRALRYRIKKLGIE